MSGSDDRPSTPAEERFRLYLRVVSGAVFLILLVVLVLVDTFGQSAGLRASEFLFGSLLGALLAIIGVEGLARAVRRDR